VVFKALQRESPITKEAIQPKKYEIQKTAIGSRISKSTRIPSADKILLI
jgi:hypothetical protein